MPKLDDSNFRLTFRDPMQQVHPDADPPFDFCSYVDAIPVDDFGGHDCSAGSVRWAWRSGDSRFEHVLIASQNDSDVFMVIVLDLEHQHVHGHRLLDLKTEYGLNPTHG